MTFPSKANIISAIDTAEQQTKSYNYEREKLLSILGADSIHEAWRRKFQRLAFETQFWRLG
jgi:hypothetical protein